MAFVTGRTMDLDQLMVAGERIIQLKRLINCELGIGRGDDDLPDRLKKTLNKGGTKGRSPDIKQMLEEYYLLRDWSKTGEPSPKKAEKAGAWQMVKII